MALEDFFNGIDKGASTYFGINKNAKALTAADLINNGLEQDYANKMALNGRYLNSQASAYDLNTINNQNAIAKQQLARDLFNNTRSQQLQTGINNAGVDLTKSQIEGINQNAQFGAASANKGLIQQTFDNTIKAGVLQGQQTLEGYDKAEHSVVLAKELLQNPQAAQEWLKSDNPIKQKTALEWMQKTQTQKDKELNAAWLKTQYDIKKDKTFADGFAAFKNRFAKVNEDTFYDMHTGQVVPRNQAVATVFGSATGDYYKLASSPNGGDALELQGSGSINVPLVMQRFGFRLAADGKFYDANGNLVSAETFNRALAQIRKESQLDVNYPYQPVQTQAPQASQQLEHTYDYEDSLGW